MPRGRWVKGQSGNPAGRKKLDLERPAALIAGIKLAASAEKVQAALDELYTIGTTNKDVRVRIHSLGEYLKYTCPPPPRTTLKGNADPLAGMSDDEINRLLKERFAFPVQVEHDRATK